jgi:hypothetical protein
MLNALLIKDQNLEENFKTYLTMLSLTIVGLQWIIPKLMALQRGWFKHVATLALGSRPRQRGCKGASQEEAQESHQRLLGV